MVGLTGFPVAAQRHLVQGKRYERCLLTPGGRCIVREGAIDRADRCQTLGTAVLPGYPGGNHGDFEGDQAILRFVPNLAIAGMVAAEQIDDLM